MYDGETEDDSGFRGAYPLGRKGTAGGTEWPGRVAKAVTGGAALKAQLTLAAVVPKCLIIDTGERPRNLSRKVTHS